MRNVHEEDQPEQLKLFLAGLAQTYDPHSEYLRKKEMAEIEQLQIRPQKLLRDLVVQRLMRVVAFFQEAPHRDFHLLQIRLRLERLHSHRERQKSAENNQRPAELMFHFGKKGFCKLAEFRFPARQRLGVDESLQIRQWTRQKIQ